MDGNMASDNEESGLAYMKTSTRAQNAKVSTMISTHNDMTITHLARRGEYGVYHLLIPPEAYYQ